MAESSAGCTGRHTPAEPGAGYSDRHTPAEPGAGYSGRHTLAEPSRYPGLSPSPFLYAKPRALGQPSMKQVMLAH